MPTNVATLAELKTAVADTGISAIAVTADIDVTSEVTCHRSDLTIDCGGHTLTNDCSSTGHKIFNFGSVIVDPGFVGIGQAGSPSRTSSLVTGTITSAGTTLAMKDEFVSLSPGDIVSIACGVNTSDPAEPAITLVMTVDSVTGPVSGTYTIHFTAAFGVDVPTYADADALKAATDPSNYYKIQSTGSYGQWYDNDGSLTVAPWLTQANFTKGLGTKHGMTTFVGGEMNHNVTLKNGTLHTILPADPHTVNSDFPLVAGDVFGFTLQDFTINNVFGDAFHSTRSHNQTITNITITGTGVASGGGSTLYANGMGSWGGTGQTYTNIIWDHTKNINGFSYEVEENNIAIDGMTFDTIEFDPTGITNSSNNFVFGLFTADSSTVTNVTFSKKAGTSATWTGFGQTTEFSNVSFGAQTTIPATLYVGDVLGSPATEDWTAGGFTIASKTYGAATTVTKSILVPASSSYNWIRMPRGVYLSQRLRLTTVGSCSDISDPLGNHYSTTLNQWSDTKDLTHSWGTLQGGTLWSDYEDGTHCLALTSASGSSPAIVEIETTYLPLTGADTSRDWLVVAWPFLTVAQDTGGGGMADLTTGLVAYFDLDNDANDDSGNGLNLTNNGTVTFDGDKGTFNGTTQFLSSSNSAFQPGSGDFMLTAQVNISGGGITISKDTDSPAGSRDFTLNTDAGVAWYVNGGGAGQATAAALTSFVDYFIAVWYTSADHTLHLQINNGTPATGNFSGGTVQSSSALFEIGARQYSGFEGFYSGTIKRVGMWKGTIPDATALTALYNSGAVLKFADFPVSDPLVAGTLAELVHDSTTASLTYATVTGGTPPYSNQLRRSTVSGSGYGNVGSPVVGNTAAPTDSGPLTPATDYYYIILTTDNASQTATSNEVHIKTAVAPPTDVQPTRQTSAYMPSFPRIHGIVTKRPMAEKE